MNAKRKTHKTQHISRPYGVRCLPISKRLQIENYFSFERKWNENFVFSVGTFRCRLCRGGVALNNNNNEPKKNNIHIKRNSCTKHREETLNHFELLAFTLRWSNFSVQQIHTLMSHTRQLFVEQCAMFNWMSSRQKPMQEKSPKRTKSERKTVEIIAVKLNGLVWICRR